MPASSDVDARPRGVQDPLFRRIRLTDGELEILRSPAFARLGRISQLGMCRYVYPGASHTRASHSIGAMHIAGEIADTVGLHSEDTRHLRVAALLHDIGQFPLSHCVEGMYRKITSGDDALTTRTDLTFFQRYCALRPRDSISDKLLGIRVLERDLDLRDRIVEAGCDPMRIANWMRAPEGIELVMLDSQYDCDRLDYVRRDSYFAGVPMGNIDLDYLVKSLYRVRAVQRVGSPMGGAPGEELVAEGEASPEFEHVPSGEPIGRLDRLAIGRKGLSALDHYLVGRFNMYTNVYLHKTVIALELMAGAVFSWLAEQGHVHSSEDELYGIVGTWDFYRFDDSYFWQAISAVANGSGGDDIEELAKALVARKPLKLVFERLVQHQRRATTFRHLADYNPSDFNQLVDDARIDPRALIVTLSQPVSKVPDLVLSRPGEALDISPKVPVPLDPRDLSPIDISQLRYLTLAAGGRQSYQWFRVYLDPAYPVAEDTEARLRSVLRTLDQ